LSLVRVRHPPDTNRTKPTRVYALAAALVPPELPDWCVAAPACSAGTSVRAVMIARPKPVSRRRRPIEASPMWRTGGTVQVVMDCRTQAR